MTVVTPHDRYLYKPLSHHFDVVAFIREILIGALQPSAPATSEAITTNHFQNYYK